MNKTKLPTAARGRQCLQLSAVDWKTYSGFLHLLGERPGIRLTYDQGELEIMSPTLEHDDGGRFVGDVIFIMTEEMGLPLKRGGSVTLRRQLLQRGIEADDCYVTPEDLLRFIQKARKAGDENAVLRQFREWIRKLIKKGNSTH